MRRHDNFEKQYNDKKERCRIERLHDNFKLYGSILEYINNIVMATKGM
jgi:hypothetical protein